MTNPTAREVKTENLQCLTTPAVREALDKYREQHRWTRSAAIEQLIMKGLGLL